MCFLHPLGSFLLCAGLELPTSVTGLVTAAATALEPWLQIVQGATRSRSLDVPKQTAPEAGADHGGGQQVAGEVTLQRQQLPEKFP